MQSHLVILQPKYLKAIMTGRKTVESRLSRRAAAPFGRIGRGDVLFLKQSCGPVCGTARVAKTLQYDNLCPDAVRRLFQKYNEDIMAEETYWQSRLDCRYCTLIWLTDVKAVGPVRICKKDWRAWALLRPGNDYGLPALLPKKDFAAAAILKAALICLAVALFCGCNPPKQQLETFNQYYQQGDFAQATCFCSRKIKDTNSQSPRGDDLLWTLQLAAIERAQKRYRSSNELFDKAEEMLKHFDQDVKGLDIVATTIVNDNMTPYRGKVHDGVMVNTYKALNFLALGQDDLARVELNRALDRQRRAKEYFNSEIAKYKTGLEKAQSEKTVDYNRSLENPDMKKQLQEKYPNLYAFEAYPDFVNPFSTYLAGVFFTVIGEPERAVDLLRETFGMVPENQYVGQDFADVEKWLDAGQKPQPAVWVMFENGVGPVKEEFRVDLPLFLFTGKVYYAGIALPKLIERYGACPYLTVRSGDVEVNTKTLAVMDRVVQTEFSKEYPQILMRAVLSAGVKIAAQYVLLEKSGNDNKSAAQAAAAAVALYQWATTAADVRIWSALPKEFQCARLPMPPDGRLPVRTPQGTDFTISLRPCRYAVVYIKMVSATDEPIVQIIEY